jgi:hypothetical protein
MTAMVITTNAKATRLTGMAGACAGCSTKVDRMYPPTVGGVRFAVQQATLRRRSRATARWPRRLA